MTKSEVKAGESDHQYKKGLWSVEEDKVLRDYVNDHGVGQWNRIAKKTGLNRCGKSCRLRWMNYLSPKVKHDDFSEQEEDLIIRMHRLIGNRWSLIAKRVPGRTDNQVKNYWNSHLSKKLGLKRRNMTKDPGEERSLCSKADKASDIAAESTNSTGSNNRQVPEAKRNPDDDGEIKVMKRLGEVLEEKESVPSIASQDQSYVSTSWQLPEEELEPITTLTIMDYHFFNGYCSFDLV